MRIVRTASCNKSHLPRVRSRFCLQGSRAIENLLLRMYYVRVYGYHPRMSTFGRHKLPARVSRHLLISYAL